MKKILISNLCGMGDVIRMEPLLRAIRENMPQAYLIFLCKQESASFLRYHPALDECLVFPVSEINQRLKKGGSVSQVIEEEMMPFFLTLNKKEIDLAILPPVFTNPYLNRFIEAKQFFGISLDEEGQEVILGEGARQMMTHLRAQRETNQKTGLRLSEQFQFLLQDLAIEPTEGILRPRFYLNRYDEKRASCILEELGLHDRAYLAFHFGSKGSERRMDHQVAIDTIRLFLEKQDLPVILGGSQFEKRSLLKKIHEGVDHPNCRLFLGQTSMMEYAAIIKKATGVLTVDSAPLHIADCFQKKMVCLLSRHSPLAEVKPFCQEVKVLQCPEMKDHDPVEICHALEESFLSDQPSVLF